MGWKKLQSFGSQREVVCEDAFYFVENKGVCYNSYVLAKADRETFEFQHNFARDKKYCYRTNEIYRGADPATFEVLNTHFAKDKNHIYNLEGIDKKVDYDTFEVLDFGIALSDDREHSNPASYSKDKNGVWIMEYYSYKPTLLKGIDAETFKAWNASYAQDNKYVLWHGKRLKKVNVLSFVVLGRNYGKDNKTIFCQSEPLPMADYHTFEVIKGAVSLAKDNNNYYHFEKVITEQEFLDLLKHYR